MSMLVRKGTMLHRKGSRRTTSSARRASIAGASPSRRPSVTPSAAGVRRPSNASDSAAGTARRANSLRPSVVVHPRASLTPVVSSPGTALPLERVLVSSTSSPRTSLTSAAAADDEHRRCSSSVISVDDRRRLYVKATAEEEGRHSVAAASYGSVGYQLREANNESTGFLDYLWRSVKIVGTTAAATFFLGVYSILPLLMMIVGVQYRKECPKEPNIPTYLVIGGAFTLVELLVLFWRQMRSRRYERLDGGIGIDGLSFDAEEEEVERTASAVTSAVTESCLVLFLLAWFALGNYWVFRVYRPRHAPLLREPSDWCDQTLYTFALAQILVTHAVLASLAIFFVSVACAARFLGVFDAKP